MVNLDFDSVRVTYDERLAILSFKGSTLNYGRDETRNKFSDDVDRILDNQKIKGFVVDFEGVKCMSSSTIGVLIRANRELEGREGGIHVCGMSEDLRGKLDLLHLQHILPVFDDEDDAVESFGF